MDKVRILMIGAGNIANTHLESYKKNDEVEIAAICDINESRLKETADLFGIEKRYTSVEEMLKNENADAADVCVWNCSHADCTIAALNAGLHVLCEKPMAYNTEQAIKMNEAAKKNGKLLMIGFVRRFLNITKVVKEFVDAGDLGEIYYTKATCTRRHGNPGGWFSNKALSGGGPVIDLGVHIIDQSRWLMGNPKPVSVYAATFDKLGRRDNLKTDVGWSPKDAKPTDICDVEDLASALIRYDNGAVTSLEVSFAKNGDGEYKNEFFGTKGGACFTDEDLKLYGEMNDYMVDITPTISNLKNDEYFFDGEMNHFVDCIKGRATCKAPAEDGIEIMKILDAIYESARTGHEVILK